MLKSGLGECKHSGISKPILGRWVTNTFFCHPFTEEEIFT